jgi:hypothetical protein
MKTTLIVHYLAVLAALACLCRALDLRAAEKPLEKGIYTTNFADQAACKVQLGKIYGAIQKYVREKEKLPQWLSDLVPDFIHDPATLVCPFVNSTGNVKKWREEFVLPVFGDPATCSYAYEFCTVPIPNVPGFTIRNYKQRQMEVIGFSVPIVRCLAHLPSLNMGFDGSIYSSPFNWEDNFVTSPKDEEVFHNVWLLTFAKSSLNKVILELTQPRPPETDARCLELSSHYNASLLHLDQMDASGKLLSPYPKGLGKINGVEFDIRGLVHLTGKSFPISFPEKVENIVVNRPCATIHFLHGAVFAAADDSRIASYVVHYDDGLTNEIPVVYGKDVRTRWFNRNQETELQNPKPAWISPPDSVGTMRQSLRLYVATWKNPRRDVGIKSIDFVSHMTPAAPFLVAITVD